MAISGNALFDRRCRLTIANPVATPNDFKHQTTDVIEIDGGVADRRGVVGMRVRFNIIKSRKKEPNNSEITITNLSPSRRSSLQHKGVHVLLEAGYKDTGVSRLFSGDVRTVDHVRSDADWDTVMHLGDGERAWKYARVNVSHAPGTRSSDVLRSLADAMGLELGNAGQQADKLNSKLDQGFCAAGSASRALDLFVRSIGKEWSVQDGELQILDPYAHLDLPVPEISPDTGLIGSPEMGSPPAKGKPALVKFKSLLIPTKPGARVKLKSKRYDGYVTVQACTFSGDTSGDDWFTEIAGVISQ